MDNRRDIGEVVKDGLSKLEKSPKNLSWDNIESQLDKNKKDKPFFLFKKRYVAVLASFLVLSGSIYYFKYFYLKPNNDQTITNKIVTTQNSFDDLEKTILETPSKNYKKTNSTLNSLETSSSNKNSDDSVISYKKKHVYQKNKNEKKLIDGFNKTSNQPNSTESNSSLLNNNNKINPENYKRYSETKIEDIPKHEIVTSEKAVEENKDTMLYMFPEKEKTSENFKNKISSISIYVSPSYSYINHTSNSFISNRFTPHNKKGKISLTFGANLNYSVNKKASFRFGYDRISMSFQENDIRSQSIINTSSILGIDLSQEIQNQLQESDFSNLNQQTNYHKASLGFQYKIYNKKISTSLIGDIGFLYQEKNELLLKVNNNTFNIGENNNILDGNVSLDLGFNLNYPILKKVHFFIEPQIEYYLFSNDNLDVNFNPIILNFRTGLLFELQE